MLKFTQNNWLSVSLVLVIVATLALTLIFNYRLVNSMIVMHVVLASLAFVVGILSLMVKKGSPTHIISGKLFFWLMTSSAVFTLIVAVMPFHVSFSMFQISVMTLYFLIGGVRSIRFKQPNTNLKLDKWMAYVVILVSSYLFVNYWIVRGEISPLLTVFGAVAVLFGLADLRLFSQSAKIRRHWLFLHLSKMLAGYTTAVTGFFVAQQILGGYFDWFVPTVACLIYIGFWAKKLKTFRHGFNKPSELTSIKDNSSQALS